LREVAAPVFHKLTAVVFFAQPMTFKFSISSKDPIKGTKTFSPLFSAEAEKKTLWKTERTKQWPECSIINSSHFGQ
jgi:hypothetical protein